MQNATKNKKTISNSLPNYLRQEQYVFIGVS